MIKTDFNHFTGDYFDDYSKLYYFVILNFIIVN